MLERESFTTTGAQENAPLLDAEEVASRLKCSVKTVHKRVREGRLGCVQVTEKARRFTREQVQAYIDSVSVEPRIDKKRVEPVRCAPPKGGEKSIGVSKADLRKEMSQWQ